MNLDRKAIIAIAASVAFLLLYRPILQWTGLAHFIEPPARPQATAVDTTATASAPVAEAPAESSIQTPPAPGASPAASGSGSIQAVTPRPVGAVIERTITLETPLYNAVFSNRGARLLSVELKRYATANGASRGELRPRHRDEEVPAGDRVVLAGGPLFAMDLGAGDGLLSLGDFPYAVSESLDAAGARRAITFTAQDSTGLTVQQTYRVRPDDYALDLEVVIKDVPANLRVSEYSLTTRSWPLTTEEDLSGDARALKATSLVGTNLHREGVGGLVKKPRVFDGSAQWAAVQTRYFLTAVAAVQGTSRGTRAGGERRTLGPEELKVLPRGAATEQEVGINALVMSLPSSTGTPNRFVLYVGPAEYFRLSSLGVHLERIVDMGWSWIVPFSALLLRVLNWLYGFIQNYGVAILLLATLVRVLLHPLNMMSMKSMRELQKLQPEIERMKEKYKKDPQAMNTAMMALYKEHKVNPAGGCLPMLLQMPLFIALYQVLYNAIELRRAPFVGWMNDLSAPDVLFDVAGFPIRLLPLLMLGTGLLSQVVTPTDPRQKPTMYLMNVMMLVFFYNLPSGLVLYWTIMNLLTALQQWMVLRGDAPVSAAVVVDEPVKRGGARRKTASGG